MFCFYSKCNELKNCTPVSKIRLCFFRKLLSKLYIKIKRWQLHQCEAIIKHGLLRPPGRWGIHFLPQKRLYFVEPWWCQKAILRGDHLRFHIVYSSQGKSTRSSIIHSCHSTPSRNTH